MSILKRYLIALFVSAPALSLAELPNDADRNVDVELAGFLYSEGVYKARTGRFVSLGQADNSEHRERPSEPVRFPDANSNNERVSSWIRSTDAKISFKELLDQ